jgi:hypothetical protein
MAALDRSANDGFGLDKTARTADAQRQQAEMAALQPALVRLNPSWPWRVRSLNPAGLGLTPVATSDGSSALQQSP